MGEMACAERGRPRWVRAVGSRQDHPRGGDRSQRVKNGCPVNTKGPLDKVANMVLAAGGGDCHDRRESMGVEVEVEGGAPLQQFNVGARIVMRLIYRCRSAG